MRQRNLLPIILLLAPLLLGAQNKPTSYTVTELNGMFGTPLKMTILRHGDAALIRHYDPAGNAQSPSSVDYFDLATHQSLSWTPGAPATNCGSGRFSGDWGDPFDSAGETMEELKSMNGKMVGTEKMLGFDTTIYEASAPPPIGKMRAWIDTTSGLVLKMVSTDANGKQTTLVEVVSVDKTAPPAAEMQVPAACLALLKQAPPPTWAQKIAKLTNDDAKNYQNALLGPASTDSCNVTYRVVAAGTMQPVTGGFQVAVDRTRRDPNSGKNVSYTIGVPTVAGNATFSGGGLEEIHSTTRDGAFRIENAPATFDIETVFTEAVGASSALIYRQCKAPEMLLLYVVKDTRKLSEGGEYLWVLGGKSKALLPGR